MRKPVLQVGTGLVLQGNGRPGAAGRWKAHVMDQAPDLSQLASWVSREELEVQTNGHDEKQEPWPCLHSPEAEQSSSKGSATLWAPPGPGLSSWALLPAGKAWTCFHGGQGYTKMGRAGGQEQTKFAMSARAGFPINCTK